MNDALAEEVAPARLAEAVAVLAPALSEGRRSSAYLVNGPRRAFGTDLRRVFVPCPLPGEASLAVMTCGVALQSSPTKELVATVAPKLLSLRPRLALTLAEGQAALGWALDRWPGLAPDFTRLLSGLAPAPPPGSGQELLARAWQISTAAAGRQLAVPEIIGGLPGAPGESIRPRTVLESVSRRLPWSGRSTRPRMWFIDSVPIGGHSGHRGQDSPETGFTDDVAEEEFTGHRLGIPYDEWDGGREMYRRNFVTVFELAGTASGLGGPRRDPDPAIARWIRKSPDRDWIRRREEGTDLDLDAYAEQVALARAGLAGNGRIYAVVEPVPRDVATAILLDATGSLAAGSLMAFQLDCAAAITRVLADAREPHGVFAFNGESRHRVEVRVLHDFADRHPASLTRAQLPPRGYTRLGAAVRHVSYRLLSVPARRRILLAFGDGRPSDEGYEGRYAVADSVRAFDEASGEGIVAGYIGLGTSLRDPLGDALGRERFTHISTVDDLGPLLANVHERLRQ